MIPLPEVVEYLDELPPEFGSAVAAVSRPPVPQRPPESVVPASELLTLARFRELMAGYGWPVQIGRMLVDRAYAFDRMALAHSSGDETLSALALELFESCRRLPSLSNSPQAH
ncbi:hypothetical protein [Eleftheria terrae]|uniref:hypothetical protein n=1 Tax=Eleftheria terrae TaxID=1597781 RepID=UPI00263AE5DC|nr:hypothetical protein [Eleftheria terrae]WKB52359.1 hypothetical protein N7L95_21590 [Eleftheria terrae]